jgi:hypothetical protein
MSLNVSPEMTAKLANVSDQPIQDSVFFKNTDGTHVERTQGAKGVYISSEADGWELRGPFDAVL